MPARRATPADDTEASRVRLDKWLWAARFFKTRQLANEAIAGGRVHVNGQRCKPGKEIGVGASIEISKDQLSWQIVVKLLNTRRGPASEAVGLYEETPESLAARQAALQKRRDEREAPAGSDGRPSKRDRRLIHRFKQTLD